MTIRNIALDPGFGGFKAAAVPWPNRQGRQGEAVKVVTVPSVVGTGSTDLGLLDLAGVTGRRRRADQPYHLAFEGVEFLVGSSVVDYTRPVERLDFQRLSDGPEQQKAAMSMLFERIEQRNGQIERYRLRPWAKGLL